jgi:hypothetical protein
MSDLPSDLARVAEAGPACLNGSGPALRPAICEGWAHRAKAAGIAPESGPCALLSASQVPKNTIKNAAVTGDSGRYR